MTDISLSMKSSVYFKGENYLSDQSEGNRDNPYQNSPSSHVHHEGKKFSNWSERRPGVNTGINK